MTRFDLQPFYRSTIGFDQIADILGNLTDEPRKSDQFPPYNIEKLDDENYRITIAVAGFNEENLDITKHQNSLTIEGKIEKSKEQKAKNQYLYKGIAERSFKLQFNIADHVFVKDVHLDKGLLVLNLKREVPEALKPQKIKVKSHRLLD